MENPTNKRDPMTSDNAVLTDEEFKEHVKKHREMAEYILKDPDDSFNPSLAVIARKEDGTEELTMCFLACPFNEAEEKQMALFGMGLKFYNEQKIVIAVILSSEAWMSRQLKKGFKNIQPRHDPNKTEAVIIVGSGVVQGQKQFYSIPIKRDDKNMMHIDGDQEEMNGLDVAFPLLEWFWKGFFSKVMPHE